MCRKYTHSRGSEVYTGAVFTSSLCIGNGSWVQEGFPLHNFIIYEIRCSLKSDLAGWTADNVSELTTMALISVTLSPLCNTPPL